MPSFYRKFLEIYRNNLSISKKRKNIKYKTDIMDLVKLAFWIGKIDIMDLVKLTFWIL